MKYAKRMAMLAAAGCLAVSATACGGGSKETEKPVKDQVEAEDPEAEDAVQEPEADAAEYEFGVLTETGYESKWLNVKFTAPENYIMVTSEEMNEVMERGAEAVNEERPMPENTQEMMVSGMEGFPNIAVVTEKLPLTNISVKQYLDIARKGLTETEEIAYSISEENAEKLIAGAEWTGFTASAEYSGVEMTQEFWVRKIGDRMAIMTVTYTDDFADEIPALMDAFVPYE